MPTQDSYSPLSAADANTFATGFRKDPVTGALTTYKIPVPFLYGGKWTVGVGVPTTPGVGPGDQYLNVQNGDTYTWDNTGLTWGAPTGTLINGSYQFPLWVSGHPLPGEKIYSFAAPTQFMFQVGMTDSIANADSAATATAVFSLTKNGAQFGSITFNAGQTTGVISCPALTTFVEGDIFEVLAPATQDVGLANVRMSLAAIRPSGAAASDIIASGEAANSAADAAASASAAAGSATAAATSAGAAASSASAASGSASSASGSATTATNKASDASGSASAAATSAGAAASSASAAAGSASSASGSAAAAATSAANAATSQAAVADALAYISGRNMIINGRGEICARGTSVVVASSQTMFGGPDRWRVVLGATGGSCTQSQGTMVGPDGVTRNSIKQTVTTAATIFTGTNVWQGINQLIEGIRCYRTLGKTTTVSGYFRASIAGTYTVALRDTASNCYTQTMTVAANTVTPYEFQIPVPVSASIPNSVGTWGLILNIGAYGTGVMTPTQGAWNAQGANGALFVATGSTAWPATAGAWIEASEVQFEVGDNKTPYDEINFEDMQRQCRRYYQPISLIKWWGYSGAGQVSGICGTFPVLMCKAPTLKTAGTIAYSNCSGMVFEGADIDHWRVYVTVTSAASYTAASTGPAWEAEL